MSVQLTNGGFYAGIDTGTGEAYVDRPAAGPWEQFTITKHNPYYDIKADAAGRQLAVNELTGALESRAAGDIHGWGGQWAISADGKTATCAGWAFALHGFQVVKPVHLEQRGYDFVDANGQRTVLTGVDMFPALRFYLDLGPSALAPFFAESNRLGFQVWRIWSQGSKRQNNFLDLSPKEAGYYESIGPFLDLCNEHGIIPLMTCFVDNQDVKSPMDHWVKLTGQAAGAKALWSGGNQWSKNGFDPWAIPNPGNSFIWSRGSDVDDVMTAPRGAPAGELHATRQSFARALMDSTASPPTMRDPKNGYGMIWMTEGNPFGDANGYSEHEAWKLGRGYSIEWALAVFHNRQSQFGQLMTEATARCAAAWVEGISLT